MESLLRWLKELPEVEYGRGVRFRESSFFVNPLLPQEVASSRANLTICAVSPQFYMNWRHAGHLVACSRE